MNLFDLATRLLAPMGLVHEPSWDDRHRTGHAWTFTNAGGVAVRVMRDPAARTVTIDVGRWSTRPEVADPLRSVHGNVATTPLHHVAYADDADLRARIETIADNLGRVLNEIPWGTPAALEAYARAFRPREADLALFEVRLPERLHRALQQLDPDLFHRIVLPHDVALRLVRRASYASAHGAVPPYVSIAIESAASESPDPRLLPSEPERLTSDADLASNLVPPAQATAAVERYVAGVLAAADRGGRGELLPEPHALWLERGRRLVPSRALVGAINAGRPSTRPFAEMLEKLGEDQWRAVYEGTAVASDPAAILVERVRTDPKTFKGYKELSDHFAASGDRARAQLWLGLGYLRAHRAPGVARAKLVAAREADPSLEGLAEAFAELEGS